MQILALIPVAALAASLLVDHFSSIKWDKLREQGAPFQEVGLAAPFVRDPDTGGYSAWRGLLWGSILIAGLTVATHFAYEFHRAVGVVLSFLAILGTVYDAVVVRRNYASIRKWEETH